MVSLSEIYIWGYFKKLVVADRLGIIVDNVFQDYDSYGGLLIAVVAMLGAVQLFCDFSGCIDIAGGVSQILGIELEKNFDHPFFSRSAAEFWRRWHITLGAWFKDYVYMPVAVSPREIKFSNWFRKRFGRQTGKAVSTIVPLSVVWVLTGIWHGTGWNYFVWGVYWGALIIASALLSTKIEAMNKFLHINTSVRSWKIFQMVRTFLIFCLGRLISQPATLKDTGIILKKFFTDIRPWELVDGTVYQLGLDSINMQIVMVCIAIVWGVGWLQTKMKLRETIARWNVVFRSAFYSIAVLSILIFGIWGPSYSATAFTYMNF